MHTNAYAETGVVFSEDQWESIQRIRAILREPDPEHDQEHDQEPDQEPANRRAGKRVSRRPANRSAGVRVSNKVITLRANPESESDSGHDYFQDSESSSEHDSEHDSEHNSEHDSEHDSKHDPEPELTNELMHLCILVITQETGAIPQYDSPLMHFLAVCGFNPNTTKLRDSMTYTPILAGALWVIRLLMLEYALPAKPWPTLGLQRPNSSASVTRAITKIRSSHLCEGTYSPTSTLLAQLAYGK